MAIKIPWDGIASGVQPRIRLTRSFDERSHSYLGYLIRLQGRIGDEDREFIVGVGKGAHQKFSFQSGERVEGLGEHVADERLEVAELYKVSKLKVVSRAAGTPAKPPPWLAVPPALEVYRERGHRRLAARTYAVSCTSCLWGCKMPVEMIIDHWNPRKKRYRTETFCYGPKSCKLYKAGPVRKVPGRQGMSWEELDWVDEEATAHRGEDE